MQNKPDIAAEAIAPSPVADQVAAAMADVDWAPNDGELPTTDAAKKRAAEVATTILETGALLGVAIQMPDFGAAGNGGVDLLFGEGTHCELLAHALGTGEARYFGRAGVAGVVCYAIKGGGSLEDLQAAAKWMADMTPEKLTASPSFKAAHEAIRNFTRGAAG